MDSHWSATEQIDVVAVNWDEAIVLYGECKWKHNSSLNKREVRKLFRQAEQIQLTTHSGNPLTRKYVFFSRDGFTEPARRMAESKGTILVDLAVPCKKVDRGSLLERNQVSDVYIELFDTILP